MCVGLGTGKRDGLCVGYLVLLPLPPELSGAGATAPKATLGGLELELWAVAEG